MCWENHQQNQMIKNLLLKNTPSPSKILRENLLKQFDIKIKNKKRQQLKIFPQALAAAVIGIIILYLGFADFEQDVQQVETFQTVISNSSAQIESPTLSNLQDYDDRFYDNREDWSISVMIYHPESSIHHYVKIEVFD